MQSHHLPVRISFGERSEALWALAPTGNAILFVHGFGGSATTTWVQFPSLLQREKPCAGYDLVFYGYDGLRTRARPNADFLIQLLDSMFSNPADFVKRSLPSANRTPRLKYKRIIIVAHSLGAVVSRLAVLDAYRKGRDWAKKVEFVFFAPAHGGAGLLPLASLALGALRLVPVEALVRYRFQVLQDLERKCSTLTELEQQTRIAIDRGCKNLIARRVIYAGQDTVVDPIDFCDDPAPEFIQLTSHTSVCKPRVDFSDPLMHVLACI
jgi:hypothetical protein